MLISLLELKREPLEFDERIPDGTIDFGNQIRQIDALLVNGRADLVEEHRGGRDVVDDIRLRAEFSGNFELPCARCLEPVEQKLSDRLDLIFRPSGADAGSSDHSISTSDTEIGYYQGDGLVLEDVLREQVLLSLPARILCRQDCKGLCPGCGSNLNQETCNCQASSPDPRWSELAGLRSRLKE